MMGTVASGWLLTIVFGLATVGETEVLIEIRGSGRAARLARAGRFWHVLAGVAMIGMLWSFGLAVPPIALIVLFSAGTLWFSGLALFPGWWVRPGSVPEAWRHASMMLSTAAMAGVMAAQQTPSVRSGEATRAWPGCRA